MPEQKKRTEPVARTSADLLAEQLARLKEIFPEAFTEGKVDFEKLRATLGDAMDERAERYSFSWAGKRDSIRLLQTPSRATLVPCPEQGVYNRKDAKTRRKENLVPSCLGGEEFFSTQNLFIEGDNLEVLKLLYKAYFGSVKMIVIDPPYNTGNDFVYPDNYADPLDTYLRITKQKDADGNLLTSNPQTSGRYHSAWLSMMYPRLFLARQLLREDGVIFVSIDDNEVANLRLVMSEIYGEENFVANLVWHKKRGKDNSAKFLSKVHDHILVFARNIDALVFQRLKLDAGTRRAYRNPDNDKRGDYRVLGLWSRGGQGGSRYAFTTKSGKRFSEREWLVGEDKMRLYDKEDRLIAIGDKLYRKLFIDENEGAIPETIWADASNNANAADELKGLFDGVAPFDTPKPVPLIKRMAQMATAGSDIVLDFFAGSCTTAQAVLEQNRADGGNRRFIMVQLPEPTGKKDFPTIADIGKERIRRVIAKMQKENAGKLDLQTRATPEDLGFKVFKLAESNFRQWNVAAQPTLEEYTAQMALFVDPLVDGWNAEKVIYEVAVKEGYGLNVRIQEREDVEGHVYRVTDPDKEQTFHLSLDDKIRLDMLKPLGLTRDHLFICRDRALDDTTAANLALQCRLKTI